MERDLTLQTASCFSIEEFERYYARNSSAFQHIREFEHSLVSDDRFQIKGICALCENPSVFDVDLLHSSVSALGRMPNWRERLTCQTCGLNNRYRAAIGIMKSRVPADQPVYFTESRDSSASVKARQIFSNFSCSDYLNAGETLFAPDLQHAGRSFERRFAAIGCFDMLDHVRQPRAVLADLHNRLRPGGCLFLTVPFLLNSAISIPPAVNLALQPSGSDPTFDTWEQTTEPVLFGWTLMQAMADVGFTGVRVELYWSCILAHLGAPQSIITANVRR